MSVPPIPDSSARCPACGGALSAPAAPCPECTRTLSDDPTAASTGRSATLRIAGYRIVRELGAGGMGTVYEAFEERMQRHVALKVLSRHLAASDKSVDRFAREAWIAGKLDHPGLVKVFERGEWEDVVYYSMELLDGGSLANVIRNLKARGRDDGWGLEFGSRDYVRWAMEQIIAAARGIDHAHRQGVVHRDIKPANILLSREPRMIKVADFGLALDVEATRMTTDGKLLGTPVYMAPEQILGRDEAIEPAVDIYALGVTLFELLTLELPYTGPTQQVYMQAVLTSEARRASRFNERVSRDLEIVLRKALEKNPKDRYASAGAFADDLDNVLSLRPIVARPSGPSERLLKWTRRRPIHAALIGTLLLGVPALGVLGHRAAEHRDLLERMEMERLQTDLRMSYQLERRDEVIRIATRIIAATPGNVLALRHRAAARNYLARTSSDKVNAEDLRNQALADIARIIELLPEAAWPHLMQARVLEEIGRQPEAASSRRLAQEKRREPPSVDDLWHESLIANDAGGYQQVIELLTRLLERDPSHTDAIALRGLANEALGEASKAVQDYRVLLALDPGGVHNYIMLGMALLQDGQKAEALGYLQRAVEMAPDNFRTHENLADAYHKMGAHLASTGEIDKGREYLLQAEREARKSLSLNPESPWSLVNLGVSLFDQCRLDETPDPVRLREAITYFEDARRLWRKAHDTQQVQVYAATWVNQCDALIQLGELQHALEACLEATRLGNVDPNSFYNLAGVYALMGRSGEALQALEKDFELGDRDWEYLLADRWFEGLRGDPRFRDLIRRMKSDTAKGSS